LKACHISFNLIILLNNNKVFIHNPKIGESLQRDESSEIFEFHWFTVPDTCGHMSRQYFSMCSLFYYLSFWFYTYTVHVVRFNLTYGCWIETLDTLPHLCVLNWNLRHASGVLNWNLLPLLLELNWNPGYLLTVLNWNFFLKSCSKATMKQVLFTNNSFLYSFKFITLLYPTECEKEKY